MTSIFDQWKHGLDKTRKVTFGKIATLFGASEITEETWEELEAILLQADLGTATTHRCDPFPPEIHCRSGCDQSGRIPVTT